MSETESRGPQKWLLSFWSLKSSGGKDSKSVIKCIFNRVEHREEDTKIMNAWGRVGWCQDSEPSLRADGLMLILEQTR